MANSVFGQVLALIRTETPEPDHRKEISENLEDFLKENTASFVDDIFKAIQAKSYKPGSVAPPTLPSKPAQGPKPPGTAQNQDVLGAGRGGASGFPKSRKRSYNESQEGGPGGDTHYSQSERQKRHIRGGRGGRGGYGGRGGFESHGHPQAASPMGSFPNMPQLPQGMHFDPNDPVTAMIAMQAMGLPPLPQMPGFPPIGSPNGHSHPRQQNATGFKNGQREKCRDYETKGFCLRGDSCPYLHGTDRLVVPGAEGTLCRNKMYDMLIRDRIRS